MIPGVEERGGMRVEARDGFVWIVVDVPGAAETYEMQVDPFRVADLVDDLRTAASVALRHRVAPWES